MQERTGSRKDSHLDICLGEEVEFASGDAGGFGAWRFDHDALPELDRADLDLSATVLGKRLSAPLIVGAMTGGTERAGEINRRLALAAAKCGVGMGLGSQRKMLEDPGVRGTYAVRDHSPGLPLLIGNVGAVQLNYGVGAPELRRLVRDVGCDAFTFHLNPLQEAIQPEGDTNFAGLLAKLAGVIPEIGVPVLVKEVGAGISETTAAKLRALPLAGVETAGLGGTSWSKVESLRNEDQLRRSVGELFARWGVPTSESILACRKHLPDLTVVASGGLRSGIDLAKAIALGADAGAMALPFLKAAEKSADAAVAAIRKVIEELRTAMFLTGSRTVSSLRQRALRRARDFTAE